LPPLRDFLWRGTLTHLLMQRANATLIQTSVGRRFAAVLLLAAGIIFYNLESGSLKDWDEAYTAERAREIQTALIREKYLSGEPTGVWDSRTQEAITRYQADHGWQTKVTPDSRALIKLGLGPNYSSSEMINPVAKPAAVTANAGATASQSATGDSRDKQ